jgi:hypothetical protein
MKKVQSENCNSASVFGLEVRSFKKHIDKSAMTYRLQRAQIEKSTFFFSI